MRRKELEYALNWLLEWLEDFDNQERIGEILNSIEEIREDLKGR